MLESLSKIGAGGAGLGSTDFGSIFAALREQQGLTFSLLAGVGAATKNNLAAIRQEDTIVMALNNAAGTITDIKATTAIADCRASATITLASAAADQTVTVAGLVYTAKASPDSSGTQFSIAGDDTADAASLAAAINARESRRNQQVSATSAAGVVTVTAVAEGTGGNAITLTKVGAGITVTGGGFLSGGTATGGIIVTGATNQVLLLWFNKR